MDQPREEATVPRVVNRATAHRLGYSDRALAHRLATGRWQRVLPHTFVTSDTVTWLDQLNAAAVFAGDGVLLTGAAALADRGLRSVHRPATMLVLAPDGRCPRSVGFVRIRPTARPMTRAVRPGPGCVTDARAVADLALERRRLDDVRALVADAVRLGLCTVDELAYELRHGPRRDSAFLREAIDEVGAGAWSAPEARAATLMRRAGLPPFEANARLVLSNGRTVIVDFLWRALAAVLEIDSDAHHALAGDADRTSERHLWLETDGFSVIHRTPRFVVRQPDRFVDDLGRWLAGRALQLR